MSAIRIIRQRLLTGAFLEVRNRAVFSSPLGFSDWDGKDISRSIYRKFQILVNVCRFVVINRIDIESNFDRSVCRNPRFRETWLSSTVKQRCIIIESSRFDSSTRKTFLRAVALNTDDILQFYRGLALSPSPSFSPRTFSSSLSSFPSISQWKLEIERIDNAAKTYPRNFLLRINLVVLRGRSKVQVPFAISAAYSHPVYLVFARSSVQTENRKKVYAYNDCLSLSLYLFSILLIPTISSFPPSPTFHAVPSRKQISRDEFHRRLRELVPVKIRVKTPLTFVASAESIAVKVRRMITATCSSIDARSDVLETGKRSSPTRSLPLPLPLYVTFSRERFNVNNPTRPRPPLRYRFSAINRVDGKGSGPAALLITTPRRCRSS